MELSTLPCIQLAGEGPINRWNYQRFGYQRLFTGVYGQVPAFDDDSEWPHKHSLFISRIRAALALVQPNPVVLYGPTALQVLGVALPQRIQDWEICHLLIPNSLTRPRRDGLMVHRTNFMPETNRWVMNLPILNPVDHWLQLSNATVDEMVAVGDGFLRRSNPLLSISDIQSRLGDLKGRHGWRSATRAMTKVRPNTDSLPETQTRLILINAGLPEPTINLPVYCPAIGRTYHVDLGYENAKVAIEYDGLVHVANRHQMEIDAQRRRHLQDAGWIIITVTAGQLRQPDSIIQSVYTALKNRQH